MRQRLTGGKVSDPVQRKRWRVIVVGILALFLLYASLDLFWPLRRDLRQFDPAAVGALETKMWRSYYDREPVALYEQLAETLRTQYHFPPLRSYLGAYHAASAAFTFKDGKRRSDYEKALPALRAYFAVIYHTGNIDFDVERAAAMELKWWIVHRDRADYPAGSLGQACAEAAATLYGLSVDRTLEHGRLRAEAMVIRDTRADRAGVTEVDWAAIETLLHRSYASLHQAYSD
jgi:hypothetical protein